VENITTLSNTDEVKGRHIKTLSVERWLFLIHCSLVRDEMAVGQLRRHACWGEPNLLLFKHKE